MANGVTKIVNTPGHYENNMANVNAGKELYIDVGSNGGLSNQYYDTPAPDPYAKWGGQAAYNTQVNGFNTQKQGIQDTANEAISNSGRTLKGSILDYLDSYKSGQNAINEMGINADLAKMSGVRDVTGMVGRGITSGSRVLANKNASNSSAAQGIAEAYGDIGRRELNKVGGQYEEANRAADSKQTELNDSYASFARKYDDEKASIVDNIVSAARNSLSALDAQIASASLPQRIQIEAEKQSIRDRAMAQLNQYDQVLSSGRAEQKALTAEQRRAQAAERSTAGYDLGANAFQYDTQAPMQMQNTGSAPGQLPLFTFPGRRNDQ